MALVDTLCSTQELKHVTFWRCALPRFPFFFRVPESVLQQSVCNVSASQGSGLASHTMSTQDGCHMLLTTSMCSHLTKITQILHENEHFHKTSLLTRTSKNQPDHKNASFLVKKCNQNVEELNLAGRWEPNPACQGCQARISSFWAKKRLILHDTL